MNTSSKSRKLIPTVLLLILINLLSNTNAQPNICTPNGGYTNNSTYDVNLDAILGTLSLNIPDNGYYAASISVLNRVETITAFALCRADLTIAQCRTCLRSAPSDLNRICQNQRQGVIWAEQNCVVRYTDGAINPPTTEKVTLINGINAANPAQFKAARDTLLSDLRRLAAGGGSGLKAGGGSRTSGSSTIYGLVQCRPDLSSSDCLSCLTEATVTLQSCCDFLTGVRILKPDCTLQYEVYSFYDANRLRERGVLLQ